MISSAAPSTPLSGISVRPDSTERETLSGAARQFEAIFVRQMLAAARKTKFDGGRFDGQAMQTFRQMQDEQFADIAAQTGTLGLATLIEAQLARFVPANSTSMTAGSSTTEAKEA